MGDLARCAGESRSRGLPGGWCSLLRTSLCAQFPDLHGLSGEYCPNRSHRRLAKNWKRSRRAINCRAGAQPNASPVLASFGQAAVDSAVAVVLMPPRTGDRHVRPRQKRRLQADAGEPRHAYRARPQRPTSRFITFGRSPRPCARRSRGHRGYCGTDRRRAGSHPA